MAPGRPLPPEGEPPDEGLLAKVLARLLSKNPIENVLGGSAPGLGRGLILKVFSLAARVRESPPLTGLGLFLLYAVYLMAIYKLIQLALFVMTVEDLKEALRWSRLRFLRFDPVPMGLALAVVLSAVLSSVSFGRRLSEKGPDEILEDLGARTLGSGYRFAAPAGAMRERVWLDCHQMALKTANLSPRPLWVLPEERAINLIAFGLSPETGLMAVTAGAVALLSPAEAEAFLAYGAARLKGGGSAGQTRLRVRLHGLMAISLFGLRLAQRGRDRIWLPWVLEFLFRGLGLLGAVLARSFQAALALGLHREGDSEAVGLMGDREEGRAALASALKKVLGWHRRGRLAAAVCSGLSPLFVVSPDRALVESRLTDLQDRIAELEPGWSRKAEVLHPIPDSMMGGREGGAR